MNRVQAPMSKNRVAFYPSSALVIALIFGVVATAIVSIQWLFVSYQSMVAQLLPEMSFSTALLLGLFGLGLALWSLVIGASDKYKPPFVVIVALAFIAFMCAWLGAQALEMGGDSFFKFIASNALWLVTAALSFTAVVDAFNERFIRTR